MMIGYFISALQQSCQERTNLFYWGGALAQRRKVIVRGDPEKKCQSHCHFYALSTLHSCLFRGGGEGTLGELGWDADWLMSGSWVGWREGSIARNGIFWGGPKLTQMFY